MFMKLAGAATAVAGTAWASTPAGAQTSGQFKAIKALAFDAYGTLFDVFSVKRLATSPAETGSAAVEKTIGIVVVAALPRALTACQLPQSLPPAGAQARPPTQAIDHYDPRPSGTRSPHCGLRRSRFRSGPCGMRRQKEDIRLASRC